MPLPGKRDDWLECNAAYYLHSSRLFYLVANADNFLATMANETLARVPERAWSPWEDAAAAAECAPDPGTIIAQAAESLVRFLMIEEPVEEIQIDEDIEQLLYCSVDMEDDLAEKVLDRAHDQALACARDEDIPSDDAARWLKAALMHLKKFRRECLSSPP